MSKTTPTPPQPEPRRVDADNPWPGLDAFEETGQDFFHGRDGEATELFRRVNEAPVTVLFGKSGLGKTSLLKAGLFPLLRRRELVPIYVRLDVRLDAPPFIDQLRAAFQATVEDEHIDAPGFEQHETLWEYLHRANLELWSADNYPLTPVLVCDQFEEIFTLGERIPTAVQAFKLEFADLAENRFPAGITARLERDHRGDNLLDLRSMRYKLVISLREDYLPELEGWRRAVPSMGRVRVRLLPMRRQQAMSVVYDAGAHLMDKAFAERVVQFVAAEQMTQDAAITADHYDDVVDTAVGEIEPALLSLFCNQLNERRKHGGEQAPRAQPPGPKPRFNDELLDTAKQGIISDYYRSCLAGLPDHVSRFIETQLISEKGFRNSYAREDAVPTYLSQEQLDLLIRRRLLRIEERQGTQRVELTHDLLTRTVREHRDERRAEDEKAVLARQTAEERKALEEQARRRELELQARLREQQLEEERRAERERRLEAEARAGRRFKWLAAALTVALLVALAATLAAARARGESFARLDRIQRGILLKLAMLSQNPSEIEKALKVGTANTRVKFCATRELLEGENRSVYRFSVFPDSKTLPTGDEAVATMTYILAYRTFHYTAVVVGAERGFKASLYDGSNCAAVNVLIEYVDPDRPPEITPFDMCETYGW